MWDALVVNDGEISLLIRGVGEMRVSRDGGGNEGATASGTDYKSMDSRLERLLELKFRLTWCCVGRRDCSGPGSW